LEGASLGVFDGVIEGPWVGEEVGPTDGPSIYDALADPVGDAETVGARVGWLEGDSDGIDGLSSRKSSSVVD